MSQFKEHLVFFVSRQQETKEETRTADVTSCWSSSRSTLVSSSPPDKRHECISGRRGEASFFKSSLTDVPPLVFNFFPRQLSESMMVSFQIALI